MKKYAIMRKNKFYNFTTKKWSDFLTYSCLIDNDVDISAILQEYGDEVEVITIRCQKRSDMIVDEVIHLD